MTLFYTPPSVLGSGLDSGKHRGRANRGNTAGSDVTAAVFFFSFFFVETGNNSCSSWELAPERNRDNLLNQQIHEDGSRGNGKINISFKRCVEMA